MSAALCGHVHEQRVDRHRQLDRDARIDRLDERPQRRRERRRVAGRANDQEKPAVRRLRVRQVRLRPHHRVVAGTPRVGDDTDDRHPRTLRVE